MSQCSIHTVLLQYIGQQDRNITSAVYQRAIQIHSTTTVCQTVVHTQ
jgi:hypothetical protein